MECMKIFGIFGDPIEHSISPIMQNAALAAMGILGCYHAFRVKSQKLEEALSGADAMGFAGLNLTIPLKEKALELEILHPDDLARSIGAANTISFGRKIRAYNTDGIGALMALEDVSINVKGRRILIVGAGGAAKAIAYTFAKSGGEMIIVNRSLLKGQQLASKVCGQSFKLGDLPELVPSADIVINATSLGMREGDPRIIAKNLFHKGQVVFDVIYNRETEMLSDARQAGAYTIDGVMMLVYQGAKALEIWTGKNAPLNVMEQAVRDELKLRHRRN